MFVCFCVCACAMCLRARAFALCLCVHVCVVCAASQPRKRVLKQLRPLSIDTLRAKSSFRGEQSTAAPLRVGQPSEAERLARFGGVRVRRALQASDGENGAAMAPWRVRCSQWRA